MISSRSVLPFKRILAASIRMLLLFRLICEAIAPAFVNVWIANESASCVSFVWVTISCVDVSSLKSCGGFPPRTNDICPMATVPFFINQVSRGNSLDLVDDFWTVIVPVITCIPVFVKVTRSEAIMLSLFHNSIPSGASGNTSTHTCIR